MPYLLLDVDEGVSDGILGFFMMTNRRLNQGKGVSNQKKIKGDIILIGPGCRCHKCDINIMANDLTSSHQTINIMFYLSLPHVRVQSSYFIIYLNIFLKHLEIFKSLNNSYFS